MGNSGRARQHVSGPGLFRCSRLHALILKVELGPVLGTGCLALAFVNLIYISVKFLITAII